MGISLWSQPDTILCTDVASAVRSKQHLLRPVVTPADDTSGGASRIAAESAERMSQKTLSWHDMIWVFFGLNAQHQPPAAYIMGCQAVAPCHALVWALTLAPLAGAAAGATADAGTVVTTTRRQGTPQSASPVAAWCTVTDRLRRLRADLEVTNTPPLKCHLLVEHLSLRFEIYRAVSATHVLLKLHLGRRCKSADVWWRSDCAASMALSKHVWIGARSDAILAQALLI